MWDDMGDEEYEALMLRGFAEAGLPEVDDDQLEAGTYSNATIKEMMRQQPLALAHLLSEIARSSDSPAAKRSTLSFGVDMFVDP